MNKELKNTLHSLYSKSSERTGHSKEINTDQTAPIDV